ncbi:MAG: PIN domain-containing protein [Deltaproteobacteria bacterium]|mgnify:CR=1 FL=1|nr:PIN domain-containing protein [Deltaproteobacteria bacterium]HDM08987.1 PIN domain-containing protein [Desulfobacteraceae bacterium]
MGQKIVFVDTSAWYALQIVDDSNHEMAKGILENLLPSCDNFLTSNHVVGETYTLLRTSKWFKEAKLFLDILRQSPRIIEYFASQEIHRQAMKILYQYKELAFSFVDAISFSIMKKEGIKEAFAFDKHFAIAGFLRVGIDIPI